MRTDEEKRVAQRAASARWRAKHDYLSYQSQYRAAHPEKVRRWSRESHARRKEYRWATTLRQYNLTVENYQALLDEQDGVCRICHGTNGDRRLEVDHDHTTGRVRGLLCGACNKGLGIFRGSPALLTAAIDYLQR